jgi:dolichol kinase
VAATDLAVNQQPLSLRHEFFRKGLHLAAAAFPVAYGLGASRGALEAALAVTVALALLTEALRRSSPALGAAFDGVFGTLTRGHEKRSITGATWLAISCLVSVVVFSRSAAIAALWCATAGDPAATIAGRLWTLSRAKHSPDAGKKTLVGSLACVLVSFAGVSGLAGYAPVIAVVIAVAAALAEAMPVPIDDNIRVAGAAGIIAQLLA